MSEKSEEFCGKVGRRKAIGAAEVWEGEGESNRGTAACKAVAYNHRAVMSPTLPPTHCHPLPGVRQTEEAEGPVEGRAE